jgi:hypothetical protein
MLGLADSSSPSKSTVTLIGLHPGTRRLDEGHELALVVLGAAAENLLLAVHLHDRRIEGVARPERDRIDRLHVVVPIEEHMRRLGPRVAIVADHHRMADRIAHARLDSDLGEHARAEFRALAAVLLVGRVGGDRLDAE